jgi:hypothetical protein
MVGQPAFCDPGFGNCNSRNGKDGGNGRRGAGKKDLELLGILRRPRLVGFTGSSHRSARTARHERRRLKKQELARVTGAWRGDGEIESTGRFQSGDAAFGGARHGDGNSVLDIPAAHPVVSHLLARWREQPAYPALPLIESSERAAGNSLVVRGLPAPGGRTRPTSLGHRKTFVVAGDRRNLTSSGATRRGVRTTRGPPVAATSAPVSGTPGGISRCISPRPPRS